MLNDSELVTVTFACCNRQRVHQFGDLKASPAAHGFACPICGGVVQYHPHEFVALMNKQPDDAPHEITLHPVQ